MGFSLTKEELDGLVMYTNSSLESHFCSWSQDVSQVDFSSTLELACGYKTFFDWLNSAVLSFLHAFSS